MQSTAALKNGKLEAAVALAREAVALCPESIQAAYNLFVTERLAREIGEAKAGNGSGGRGGLDGRSQQSENNEEQALQSTAPGGYYRRREPWGWEWVLEDKEEGEEQCEYTIAAVSGRCSRAKAPLTHHRRPAVSFVDEQFLYHLKLLLPSEELGPDEAKAKADRAKALGLPHIGGTPFVLSVERGEDGSAPSEIIAAFAKHAGAMPRV